MSRRCLKILLPLFFVQIIVAQLPSHLGNHGCQSFPAPDISQNFNGQPSGNNFPGISNIPFISNLPINGNAPVNGLQMIPKLPFVNGQINDLINFASNINNRQLSGNNPSTLIQNSPINNKLQQPLNGLLLNNVAQNNPYLPVNNNVYPNIFNNVPNNIISAANNMPCHNLPVFNNAFNPNTLQYHLSENNNVPLPNLPMNKVGKINGLTLSGEAFNNGIPFNVVPANMAYNNVNDVPINNYFNYNNGPNNGLKITRSLPENEVPEIGYPIANNIIENNGITARQSYNNEVHTVTTPQNSIISNGLPLNNGLPYLAPTASNAPTVFPLSDTYPANGILVNNESPNSFTARNFNNIQPNNEQILNNYQMAVNNEWQQPLSPIQSYQNTDLSLANLPMNNVGFSQSAGINLNLQDLANLNVLNLGEFGNLPVFSGLPVIGVTETVTVINPDQFNQNQILSY